MPSIDHPAPLAAREIRLAEHGGPEVLRYADVIVAEPAPGEIRLRQTAVGVNFHDIYVREGSSGTLALPGVLGIEAVGVVEAVGEDVAGIRVGERMGYVTPDYGAYAEVRNIPSSVAFRLPNNIDDAAAASSLMKALTVRMLLHEAFNVKAGQQILVHSAAGGTGQLLCQWAKAIGAKVIATVGQASKIETAQRAGADHVINREVADVAEAVRGFTAGAGVDAVYDAIGIDTFDTSLDCLGYGGALVSYGQASGSPGTVSVSRLASRSLTLTRPVIFHFLRTEQQRTRAMKAVLDAFETGRLRPLDPLRFPFANVREAHAALASGSGPGGVVLEVGHEE